MSRFALFLALVALLFAGAFAEASLNSTSVLGEDGLGAVAGRQWTVVTRAAQWSPRAGGVVEWYTGSTRNAAGRTVNGPMMLLYGVGVWSTSEPEDRIDVWYSLTKGRSWLPVGQTGEGFSPLLSAITVQDSAGRQYRIQGAQAQPLNDGSFSEVYRSDNGGATWLMVGEVPSATGRFLGQAVVDSKDNIYVTFGQSGWQALNDIYVSSNKGVTWRAVNPRGTSMPPSRAVHGSVAGKFRDGTDAMWVMYGWLRGSSQAGIGNVYTNDVWVTTTGGTTWVQLLAHAPWAARGDCQIEITNNGIIIVAGGVSSANGDEKRQLNDVWASLDGGYSWGLCSDNAEFSDRQFQYTVIDDAGYLYVMGGIENEAGSRQTNDVWVSAFSFNDPAEVAARCDLFVPSCGVGLKCLPNEGDTTFMQGNWGVSCAACPYSASVGGSSSASAASNIMTILFVVFLLLFLATLAALIFTYYKIRGSGVTSPIPLPAGAQRWWNSNTESAGGLNEGLAKGPTSDDTYSQLSIRDQM